MRRLRRETVNILCRCRAAPNEVRGRRFADTDITLDLKCLIRAVGEVVMKHQMCEQLVRE